MLRLYILRHLKTGWALPGQKDIDRQLNAQGISDAGIVGRWISEKGYTPEQVYCSNAVRTRSTLDLIAGSFSSSPNTEIVPAFYSGFVNEYLEVIHGHNEPQSIMVIGHNPTCASLANMLAAKGDPSALDEISYSYPTGSLAVIDFDTNNWSEIREGGGKLVEFLTPKAERRP